MLTCHDLLCQRGERTVFKGIGFTLGAGGAIVLRGPNGSGKSSLLKMLAGITKPAAGSIEWDHYDIYELYPEYSYALQYIGHKLAVKPEWTVAENLLFWAEMRDSLELIPAAITHFGLGDYWDVPCYKLSAGWQKRVALARLVACHADLWLLDEPFTHLDQQACLLLKNLITIRCKEGGLAIIASHGEVPLPFAQEINMLDFSGE